MVEIKREIRKTISIGYTTNKDRVYFKDYNAVRFIWGAETASTDMRYAHKDDKGIYITKDKLRERLQKLRVRNHRTIEAISVLEQLGLEDEK